MPHTCFYEKDYNYSSKEPQVVHAMQHVQARAHISVLAWCVLVQSCRGPPELCAQEYNILVTLLLLCAKLCS